MIDGNFPFSQISAERSVPQNHQPGNKEWKPQQIMFQYPQPKSKDQFLNSLDIVHIKSKPQLEVKRSDFFQKNELRTSGEYAPLKNGNEVKNSYYQFHSKINQRVPM